MRTLLRTPILDLLPRDISWPIFIVITLQLLQSSLLNAAFVFLLNVFLILRCYKINLKKYLLEKFQYYFWFLLFEVWAVTSITWSALPKVTAHAVMIEVAYFISIVLSIVYTIHFNKNLFKTLIFSSLFIVFLIYVYFLISPGGSYLEGNLVSFYKSKNILGMTLAITLLTITLSDIHIKHKLLWAGIGVGALVVSNSKTSMSGFFITIFITAFVHTIIKWFDNRDKYIRSIVISFANLSKLMACLIVIGLFIYRLEIVSYLIHNLTDDMLTGRGKLWHSVLIMAKSNLEQGLGVAVMWGADRSSEIAQSQIYLEQWVQELTSADGGYIDLIASLGFIGLCLIYFSFIQTYANLFASRSQKGFYLLLGLVTFIFIHNFTESHIYRFRDILWSLYTYLYFYIAFTRPNSTDKRVVKAHI